MGLDEVSCQGRGDCHCGGWCREAAQSSGTIAELGFAQPESISIFAAHSSVTSCRRCRAVPRHVALLAAGSRPTCASYRPSPCCRGRLTERFVACKVVAPLLQGLRALHSQRIIHRSVLLHCCIRASCSPSSSCITAQVRPAPPLRFQSPSVLPQNLEGLEGCLAPLLAPNVISVPYSCNRHPLPCLCFAYHVLGSSLGVVSPACTCCSMQAFLWQCISPATEQRHTALAQRSPWSSSACASQLPSSLQGHQAGAPIF